MCVCVGIFRSFPRQAENASEIEMPSSESQSAPPSKQETYLSDSCVLQYYLDALLVGRGHDKASAAGRAVAHKPRQG